MLKDIILISNSSRIFIFLPNSQDFFILRLYDEIYLISPRYAAAYRGIDNPLAYLPSACRRYRPFFTPEIVRQTLTNVYINYGRLAKMDFKLKIYPFLTSFRNSKRYLFQK